MKSLFNRKIKFILFVLATAIIISSFVLAFADNIVNQNSEITADTVPETGYYNLNEIEPNDSFSEANSMAYNLNVGSIYEISGIINPPDSNEVYTDDMDYYNLTVNSTGTVSIVGRWDGAGYVEKCLEKDLHISLYDSSGNLISVSSLTENLDEDPEGLNYKVQVIRYTLSSGTYTIAVQADPSSQNYFAGAQYEVTLDFQPATVKYTTYIQGSGWQNYMYDGLTSGTAGQTSMIEGIKIEASTNINLGVQYSAQVQGIGWQNYVSDGATAGTEGQSKRLEAIKIKLTGSDADLYDVYYRVYAQDYGWLSWTKNDIAAGTEGLSTYLSAIEINIVLKSNAPTVDTTYPFRGINGIEITKLPNKTTYNLCDALDLTGLEVSLVDNLSNKKVVTSGYTVSGYNPKKSGDQTIIVTYGSYTATFTVNVIMYGNEITNMGNTSETSNYYGKYYVSNNIVYATRTVNDGSGGDYVHTQIRVYLMAGQTYTFNCNTSFEFATGGRIVLMLDNGYDTFISLWGNNNYDFTPSVSGNYYLRFSVTAYNSTQTFSDLCIRLKNQSGLIYYTSCGQEYLWQNYVGDGAVSGTVGQSRRLEAVLIRLPAKLVGSVSYSSHVSDIGWMGTVYDGALSGTIGQSKRLEAIRINLSGQVAQQYDIYYSAHVENIGWMGWAKNGESAGTSGYSYSIQALQIVLVPKGGAAPGSTANAYIYK